jgi:hypothetical protein
VDELTDLYTDNNAYYQYRAGWRGFFITKTAPTPRRHQVRHVRRQQAPQYTMMWGFEGRDRNWNDDK